ncbi:AIPR family protein [Sporanaerobacter sp. PP17-6a]|uniref:AIPR family protein n=1 Tax=Sporanaerobacter sp. PP17-6a TaxID=1891289 RepID=UPI0008A09A56|nr:AIPR family protein [Sporanaerobacter sp. PP17-6a]SCL81224.1 AIPR protein [Sporanaerobacter sp. PP17-6a]
MSNKLRLINSIIKRFKNENGLDDLLLFEVFSISQILKNRQIDFDDIENSIVDGGNDGGIDSIIILLNDSNLNTVEELDELKNNGELNRKTELEIYIIQAKDSSSFKERVFDTLSLTIQDIFDYEKGHDNLIKKYNPLLVDRILLLRKTLDEVMITSNNVVIKVVYASKGDTSQISSGVKNKAESIRNILIEKSSVTNSIIEYYGADELRKIYIEPEENELILKFKADFSSTFDGIIGLGYVVLSNIVDYFKFVTKDDGKIREGIFENNIRHFQGKVAVNRGMMNTLNKDVDLEFWWLNNGITILANEIVPLPDNKLRVKNIQIVNGLQTTFCIYNHFKNLSRDELSDNRSVLIKLIKTDDEKIMDKIIYSTNSQTEVRPADLRATDELQRDIENYFLSKGFYYDRRKNYYKNQNKERAKIFNIAKTAQYIETLLFKRPHIARANPTSLLKTDDNYKRIFNNSINIGAYLKACLLFRKTSQYVKEKTHSEDIINNKYGASIKNLSFHIMLVSISLYFNNFNFNDTDLANLDLDKIDTSYFDNSVIYLVDIIDKMEENKNIINIAKSKNYTTLIKERFDH